MPPPASSSFSPPPLPPPSALSPAQRGARRFWLALGLYALVVVGILAGLYLEENWRGARAWAACQRELRAKGETLEWEAFIPPPVPDAQNLAMAPLFARALAYRTDPKTHVYTFGPPELMPEEFKNMPFGASGTSNLRFGGWQTARRLDLTALQWHYRDDAKFPRASPPQAPADDVLLALSRYGPSLDELARAAAERPLTRFPVDWRQEDPFASPLPQYTLAQKLTAVLRLRATAQLQTGHADAALTDLKLMLRLSRDQCVDPNLISHLVLTTCVNLALSAVWEGLAERRWSAAQLADLQADLQRFDLPATYRAALRGERAYDLRDFDFRARRGDEISYLLGVPSLPNQRTSQPMRLLGKIVPQGWYDLNKAYVARHEQTCFIEALDPEAHRIDAAKSAVSSGASSALPYSPANSFAKLMLPVFRALTARTALTQTGLDEAATACALERFYLDRKAYPARLGELVPAYLARVPTDVIDGTPLRYLPTSNGRYRLYGVGWNGRDDGGQVVWRDARGLDNQKGDWVWQYAELSPPPPGH